MPKPCTAPSHAPRCSAPEDLDSPQVGPLLLLAQPRLQWAHGAPWWEAADLLVPQTRPKWNQGNLCVISGLCCEQGRAPVTSHIFISPHSKQAQKSPARWLRLCSQSSWCCTWAM